MHKTPSVNLTIAMSPEMKSEMETTAASFGMSVSEYVRQKVFRTKGTEFSGIADDPSFPKTREEWTASATLRLVELADEIKRQGEVLNELEFFIKHGGTREQFFAEGRHKLKVTYISDEPPDPLEGLREVVNTKTKT